ncbi:hypothetical protein A2U01_0092223, partial [Trifolium medium]|nr:hypothetical protein [Trifolium medium]
GLSEYTQGDPLMSYSIADLGRILNDEPLYVDPIGQPSSSGDGRGEATSSGRRGRASNTNFH